MRRHPRNEMSPQTPARGAHYGANWCFCRQVIERKGEEGLKSLLFGVTVEGHITVMWTACTRSSELICMQQWCVLRFWGSDIGTSVVESSDMCPQRKGKGPENLLNYSSSFTSVCISNPKVLQLKVWLELNLCSRYKWLMNKSCDTAWLVINNRHKHHWTFGWIPFSNSSIFPSLLFLSTTVNQNTDLGHVEEMKNDAFCILFQNSEAKWHPNCQ